MARTTDMAHGAEALGAPAEGAPDREARLMLRMFQAANLIGLASCGLALFVAWPAGHLTGLEKVTIPILAVAFVAMLAAIHLTGHRHLVLLGHVFFGAAAVFLVLNLANALFFQRNPALAAIYAYWMPVLYILGTTVLGITRSQRICWGVFAVVAATYALWFAVGRDDGAEALVLPMELILAESLITQAAALGLLYVLAVFRERNAAAQARAAVLEGQAAQLQAAVDEANAARSEAEAASQARALFVATMNHELRTPLNAILGFAEIIRDRRLGDDALASYAAYAGHIHRSGVTLRTLVDDILEYARIEADRLELELEPCALDEVIEEVIGMMQTSVHDAGLTLDRSAVGAIPAARADRRAVRLMAVNLVVNAIQRSPAGGTVAIAAGADEHGWARIAVSDSGPALSEEQRRTLFEPFAYRGSILEAQAAGAGIGPFIVKSLVDRHDGRIDVEDAAGGGTRIDVRLPPAQG